MNKIKLDINTNTVPKGVIEHVTHYNTTIKLAADFPGQIKFDLKLAL